MVATATVTEAIREANRNFAKLFASRDAEGIARMYLRDAMLLPPGAALVKGHDNILAFWRGAMEGSMGAVSGLVLDTIDTDMSGDLVIEVGTYKILDEDRQPAGDGKYMVAWKEDHGTWRIYRDVWNANQ